MIVSLDEMKQYLRVDFPDDDELLLNALQSAETLCRDVARLSAEDFSKEPVAKIAVMYAVAYLYEHREETDHKELMLSLRNILFGVREVKF